MPRVKAEFKAFDSHSLCFVGHYNSCKFCEINSQIESSITSQKKRGLYKSKDEHAVAVAVEPVFLLDCFLVGFFDEVEAGKGCNEHQQG